uniref:Hemerythrin-like domain-containing protein n=1 Tax=Chaetoceros debilis TaxID=122233 RepID=A0A7S3Q4D6_9STRA
MEAWSKRIPQVQFLCVCVESKQVAISFQSMFFRSSNSNVVNGYIPSRNYMPVGYGQLGCSGFIVSDKDGKFLSKKTRAYLQFGEAAFDYVESLLAPHIVIDLTSEGDNNDDNNNGDEEKKEEDIVDDSKKVEMPASVGVTAMDDEHQECTDAFNQVIEHPTQETLKHLSEVLSCHFAHEEELMKQFSKRAKRRASSRHTTSNSNTNNSTSNSMSSFSALDSHIMDHKRILNILNEEVHRLNSCGLKGK